MRDYASEVNKRVDFIREILGSAGADGVVYGNSGGKDSALAGILCKKACENTIGLIMPCGSKRNYGIDMSDALTVAKHYDIETGIIDLSAAADEIKKALSAETDITNNAAVNIAPRLRMTALYAVAASGNRLVAGTGNRSEGYMGYFTKWGDGAFDFNPIADLTVSEIYEFLRFLDAPECIIAKPPSAGLFDGQTDESEMGVTYKAIDEYLLNGICNPDDKKIIEKYHKMSAHKRREPYVFNDDRK